MTTTDVHESLSQFLARQVHSTQLRDVPTAAKHRARLLLLDAIGVQLAAAPLPSSRSIRSSVLSMGGPAEATLVGSTEKVPSSGAALANGALVHSLDFDDTHLPAQVHVAGATMPATFATAERIGSTGADVLEAFICGAEVSVRMGMGAPGKFFDRGFHPTGVCGTIGATAAVGKLLKLDDASLTHAFGIAASQAAGINAYLDDPGSWVKRLHPGWAAHSGTFAATLAQHGVTAPTTALESRFGLYSVHVGDDYDVELARIPFEQAWETARIGLKPYPTGQYNIPFMHLTKELLDSSGATAAEIAGIECRVNAEAVSVVCEPLEAKQSPRTGYAAKFSLPYSVAAMLVRGRATLDEFSEEAAISPEIVDLARKVTYSVDPEADFPRYYPAWVVLTLNDGRIIEGKEPINLGHPDNPLTEADVLAKYRACAERVLSASDTEHLAELVLDIDQLSDLHPLSAVLSKAQA